MADNFWAAPSTDPKRAYRWLLYLNGGADVALPNWVITKVSQPSFEVSEKEHQFINHKFYYPGRVTWTDVKFTLVDPISPDATQQLQNVLTKSGYIYPDKQLIQNMTDTISKKRAISVTPKVKIQLIGAHDDVRPGGDAFGQAPKLGSWVLENAWVKSVTFSELSYESEELVNAEVTLRYDWAVYTKENG
jgi:hypothetical protein|tara:strand:+ start:231 stop:800 length:570 start_codon:yes stop_codon:yes gene_type:complete